MIRNLQLKRTRFSVSFLFFFFFLLGRSRCSGIDLPSEPILTNTGLKLDKKITEDGSNNDGIFSLSAPYKGHPADSLLVKVLHMVYEGALGEVKALNMKHQVIASGMLADPKIGPKEKPVIVMMKQPGKKLLDDEEFQKASNEEKLAMRKEALELMCEELAQEAVEKLMYHADNNIANLMVVVKNKKIVSARVVDYGGDAVYHVKQGVKKEDVKAFCLKINPATWA
ncbi:hypothetical protein GYMLUDRAFT_934122 [Collybiopsis luxurians FD-317 M1]|nr:hypothetical protein GYMLUDRAFT_934122 [Collybiopsis luxurians FD-317 M1]